MSAHKPQQAHVRNFYLACSKALNGSRLEHIDGVAHRAPNQRRMPPKDLQFQIFSRLDHGSLHSKSDLLEYQ